MSEEYQDVKINAEQPKKKRVKIKECEEWLSNHFEFRYNLVNYKPQYKTKDDKKWSNVDDDFLASLWRKIQHDGYNFNTGYLWDVLKSDFSERVDPILEYFYQSNANYDPDVDYIAELAASITVSNYSPEQWARFLKMWIVGMVANVMDKEDCKNHLCLILAGEQYVGKTRWLKSLLPPTLSDYYVQSKIDPESKDSLLLTTTNMFVNIDDYFDSVSKKKADSLKGFITDPIVKCRLPYGRTDVTRPKICSFGGTSNELGILYDTTGSRRFIVGGVSTINHDKSESVDRDKVFAQAFHLYLKSLKGEHQYWLSKEDKKILEKANEVFQVDSHELELLSKYVRHPENDKESRIEFLTNSDLLVRLGAYTNQRITQRKLGQALKKLGYKRGAYDRNQRGLKLYKVVWLGEELRKEYRDSGDSVAEAVNEQQDLPF